MVRWYQTKPPLPISRLRSCLTIPGHSERARIEYRRTDGQVRVGHFAAVTK